MEGVSSKRTTKPIEVASSKRMTKPIYSNTRRQQPADDRTDVGGYLTKEEHNQLTKD